MISWWRYVIFEQVSSREAEGWIVDCVLGAHSVLMRWAGEGEPT